MSPPPADKNVANSFLQKARTEPDGITVLSAPRDNPYTVANMLIAKNNLIQQGVQDAALINVRTTHKYIRFLPVNIAEVNQIVKDLDPILFDEPLDRKILHAGTYYHDPLVPDSVPTPQYTVVDANFTYALVNWELIDNVYIPEDDSLLKNETLENALIIEAFTLTKNKDELSLEKASKWKPAGKVQVWDDAVGSYIPVKECLVRAKRFVKLGRDYTDANGNFYIDKKFRYKVNYSIKWKCHDTFRIRDGLFFTAKFDGPHQKGDWNLNIGGLSDQNKSMRFATIHRAANRYFYENIDGLQRPLPGYAPPISISYRHVESESPGLNIGYVVPFVSEIYIKGKSSDGIYLKTHDIFSTTVHELGHASHSRLMGNIQFWQVSNQIQESWADCIEWYITKLEYESLGVSDYNSNDGESDWKQRWTGFGSDFSEIYTPLFIDFLDSHNQSRLNPNGTLRSTLPADPCPGDANPDGAGNCYIGIAPSGTNAFIYNEHFYYSPVGCCDCPYPGSWYDGANCYLQDIPEDRIGFIYNNRWYLMPLGDPQFPYDVINGFTISQIESDIIPHAYGLTSLRSELLSNLPSGMTPKKLNIYLDFYFAL